MLTIYPLSKSITESVTTPVDFTLVLKLFNVANNWNLTDSDIEGIIKILNNEPCHHKTIQSLTNKNSYPLPKWISDLKSQVSYTIQFKFDDRHSLPSSLPISNEQ